MSIGTSVEMLTDDARWYGGWYQPIVFPDGSMTHSTKFDDDTFYGIQSLGLHKWDDVISPNLPGGDTLLDIGCNAGLYLVMASKAGFRNIYGIEESPYFLDQCRFVLDQFGVDADLHCANATEFDYSLLPHIDVTLMANTLYWITYSDEDGFVDDADRKMHEFARKLSTKTTWLLAVGREGIDRMGGSLDRTVPLLDNYFTIERTNTYALPDGILNTILCKSE